MRELLSLPPFLCGFQDIPDSVEILGFSVARWTPIDVSDCAAARCALSFGRESRLTRIAKYIDLSVPTDQMKIPFRLFVQLSSQSLRLLRLISEFESEREDSVL
jgi:hypothetical protein